MEASLVGFHPATGAHAPAVGASVLGMMPQTMGIFSHDAANVSLALRARHRILEVLGSDSQIRGIELGPWGVVNLDLFSFLLLEDEGSVPLFAFNALLISDLCFCHNSILSSGFRKQEIS